MKVISGAALRFYFSTFILIMPLTSKRNLKNPFDCPNCTQIFQTRGGLSQHYRKKHRPLTDLYETNLGDNDAIPLLPDIVGVPPDIAKISNIIHDQPSPTQGQVSLCEFQFDEDEDDDLYTGGDADTDTEDSDLDTPVDIRDGLAKLPEMLKFGDTHFHPDAGYIYDAPGQESHSWKVQEQDHRRLGHPYYPWSSENELWLSNFIFFKAKMTIGVADTMIGGIRDGRLRMDGLATTRARKMLSIIDDGVKFVPVSLIAFGFMFCETGY